MDFDADVSEVNPLPPGGLGQDPEWSQYPQSLFGNWTHDQVERCGVLKSTHNETCSVHKVDVLQTGHLTKVTRIVPLKSRIREHFGTAWRPVSVSTFRPLGRTGGSVTAFFRYSSACIVCREYDSASSQNPGHQVSD